MFLLVVAAFEQGHDSVSGLCPSADSGNFDDLKAELQRFIGGKKPAPKVGGKHNMLSVLQTLKRVLKAAQLQLDDFKLRNFPYFDKSSQSENRIPLDQDALDKMILDFVKIEN